MFLNSTGKSRRPVRRHFTAHFDRDNVATRQVSLQNLYSRLVEMAEVNRICMLSGLGPVYKDGGGAQVGEVTRIVMKDYIDGRVASPTSM